MKPYLHIIHDENNAEHVEYNSIRLMIFRDVLHERYSINRIILNDKININFKSEEVARDTYIKLTNELSNSLFKNKCIMLEIDILELEKRKDVSKCDL